MACNVIRKECGRRGGGGVKGLIFSPVASLTVMAGSIQTDILVSGLNFSGAYLAFNVLVIN